MYAASFYCLADGKVSAAAKLVTAAGSFGFVAFTIGACPSPLHKDALTHADALAHQLLLTVGSKGVPQGDLSHFYMPKAASADMEAAASHESEKTK